MLKFEEYAQKYRFIRMERREGILQMTLHTDGGPLRWSLEAQAECAWALSDVGADRDNRIVILTGTGDEFNGPKGSPETFPIATARGWEFSHWNVRKLLWNLLDVECPMIAAINGPVWRHCETPLLCDIVLAAEHTQFQDSGHYVNGLVPGDGMQIVLPLLLGINRARYFMLTGQVIDARQALDLGMVSEVLPADRLVPRAWELAEQLVGQSPMVSKYTKVAFVHQIRQHLLANHGYGLLLEGMACIDDSSTRTGYALPERG